MGASSKFWNLLLIVFFVRALFVYLHEIIPSGRKLDENCKDLLPKFNPVRSEFPWIVFIETTTIVEESFGHTRFVRRNCGGTIIRKNWILTAAHCLIDESHPDPISSVYSIKIIAGVHNLSSDFSDQAEQVRGDGSFVIHQNYKLSPRNEFGKLGLENDIALIELDEDLELNEFVSTIKIGEDSFFDSWIHSWTAFLKCETAGWGKLTDCKDHDGAESLMKARPKILRMSSNSILTTAVSGQGDSGGPIVCRSQLSIFDSKFYLFGITSQSLVLDSPSIFQRRADLFVRLTPYTDWIDLQLTSEQPRSKSISHFQGKARLQKELVDKVVGVFILAFMGYYFGYR